MEDFEIRVAAQQDMHTCAAIYESWVAETEWMPKLYTFDEILRHFCEDVFTQTVFVATDKGRSTVVGFLSVSSDSEITNLYVNSEWRGRGIGRNLLQRASEQSAKPLVLRAFRQNIAACRFYETNGFGVIGGSLSDNAEGLPDFHFKSLAEKWNRK